VTAVWFSISYTSSFRTMLLGVVAGFVSFYLAAPRLAQWLSRPLSGVAARAMYAAPLLLFAFPVLARIDPEYASPWKLFVPLLALLVLCAWRAIVATEAFLYFIAAFFGVAAQAVWSVQHLTVPRVRTAVLLYGTFGILSSAVPVVARRLGRTLRPEAAPGVMLLASLGLLYYLASGDIAPAALWALALLLAILNAGVFIESAAARLPVVAIAGTVLSWTILAAWWSRAAATVGVLPSLLVVTLLTLVTLAGYSWAHLSARERPDAAEPAGFANGLHLSLAGHLFLFFVAVNREWSLPPWPLFATLAVLTPAACTQPVSWLPVSSSWRGQRMPLLPCGPPSALRRPLPCRLSRSSGCRSPGDLDRLQVLPPARPRRCFWQSSRWRSRRRCNRARRSSSSSWRTSRCSLHCSPWHGRSVGRMSLPAQRSSRGSG
jgi:hypothetical protein